MLARLLIARLADDVGYASSLPWFLGSEISGSSVAALAEQSRILGA